MDFAEPLPELHALADWTLHILLLAAETDLQQFLWRVLQRVYPAAQITGLVSGPEAVMAFEARSADLVLIATPVPDMPAAEVMQCIHQMAAHVPIVILADTPAEAAQHDPSATAYARVQPLSPTQLYQTLKALPLLPPAPVHFDAVALLERLDGDQALAHRLIAQALLMLASETLPASDLLDAESGKDLRQQAHRIKGMAANLSLLALRDYAQALEQQARLLEQSSAAPAAETLHQCIQQLAVEMALLQKMPLWPGEDLPLQV
ncbi:MAG: response regulator [Candidatus Sericytochromatia bacterium]|nr:response regulator [Candidatus Sericytochromatia bacterium]